MISSNTFKGICNMCTVDPAKSNLIVGIQASSNHCASKPDRRMIGSILSKGLEVFMKLLMFLPEADGPLTGLG